MGGLAVFNDLLSEKFSGDERTPITRLKIEEVPQERAELAIAPFELSNEASVHKNTIAPKPVLIPGESAVGRRCEKNAALVRGGAGVVMCFGVRVRAFGSWSSTAESGGV